MASGVTTPLDMSADQLHEPAWDEAPRGWLDSSSSGFLTSLLLHMVIVLSLAILPSFEDSQDLSSVVVTVPPQFDQLEEPEAIEDFVFSDVPQQEIGADSMAGETMAQGTAPSLSEIAQISSPLEMAPQELANVDLSPMMVESVAPLTSDLVIKGKVGEGTTGASGAIDRITFEILKSLEERPTLVVWLFDQSGSLTRQRKEIRDRFDRIYQELGIVEASGAEAFAEREDGEPPLLTSVIGFGQSVQLLTAQPTADLDEIKAAVDGMQTDTSGVERVFQAVYKAADTFKHFRRQRGSRGPERNVLIVVVTDERGDDWQGLEATIEMCRKFSIPVYTIGTPAPFGREKTYIKYVDPDPKFDQTPQWAEIDQGPESLLLERVQLTSAGMRLEEEPTMDSGFGPFALTRLCYETGGIFFTVHPNRRNDGPVGADEIAPFASRLRYFFDPDLMSRYRPDYVSSEEYRARVEQSPLRQSLVTAALRSQTKDFQPTALRFVRRDEASLANELTRAQQAAALLEPRLVALYEILETGQAGRAAETSPRWLASYDLELGRVLAAKVRTETYNAMLAKAKRGMPFQDPKNNTWVLKPSNEISVGSRWEREAKQARELLANVATDHAGTPWGLLAMRELEAPVGWTWVETFTDLEPPPRENPGNNNNNPPPPQDDQARMLPPPPPKRPVPKL